MPFATPEFLPAAPEIALAGMACVVLMVDLYAGRRHRMLVYQLAQASLVVSAVLCIALYPEEPITTFSGTFKSDGMSAVLKVFVLLVTYFVLFYSKVYLQARELFRGEYFVLCLFAVLGMMVLVSAASLLTLYLGLELMSLCLYALVALNRASAEASEAAMKYFVLGALASGTLLYGMSLLYGVTGTPGARPHPRVPRGRRRARHDPRARAGVHRSGGRVQAGGGALPHVGARRLRGGPDRGDPVRGHRPEDRRFRHVDAAAGGRNARPEGRLDRHADDSGGAVDGRRQRHRHRAVEPQTHARVLDHRSRRLPSPGGRRGHAGGLRGLDVLHHRVRPHGAGGLRDDHRARTQGLRVGSPGRLPRTQRAQSLARLPGPDTDALDGGDAALRGLLGPSGRCFAKWWRRVRSGSRWPRWCLPSSGCSTTCGCCGSCTSRSRPMRPRSPAAPK